MKILIWTINYKCNYKKTIFLVLSCIRMLLLNVQFSKECSEVTEARRKKSPKKHTVDFFLLGLFF